jgi:drug/metabolite transporter (DMT)-like permease
MMTEQSAQPGITWLAFALLTVVSWGVYGVFLHTGQVAMGDPINGRYKAFLFVGIAYFLTAVLAPLALLMAKGAAWTGYTPKGMWWSLIAGIVGAIGAFGVLLAFGAKGTPAVVMSIVFAGAPIVNALYSLILHPPAGGWSQVRWQFYLGIALAALGGCLVTFYKPAAPAPVKAAVTATPGAKASSPASAQRPASNEPRKS